MSNRYRTVLMWTLYGVLFLLAAVAQTVLFGHERLLGAKFALLPVALACITMHTGAEHGGLFGLIAGALWCLSDGDGGGLSVISMTLAALAAGYLCDRYLNRNLLSAAMMSLMGLLVCQGLLCLLKLYLGTVGAEAILTFLAQMLISVPWFLPMYFAAKLICRFGRPRTI
ncbi:MAG: rod shape-determining protein MreD [Oscillospiraceae bacterium]|nr:rod shape-determining protein MreD [Oscillospiraceae bacterium]